MIDEHLTVTGISKATHSDVNKQTNKKTREVVPSGTVPIPSVAEAAGESGCSGGAQLKTLMQPLHQVVNNASWKVVCTLRFHWNHYEETK